MGDFKLDPSFEKDVINEPGVTAAIMSIGEAVLSSAKNLAAEVPRDTGKFAESITGEFKRDRKGKPHYFVASTDEGSIAIEFGTSDTGPHRVLGRAIRSVHG